MKFKMGILIDKMKSRIEEQQIITDNVCNENKTLKISLFQLEQDNKEKQTALKKAEDECSHYVDLKHKQEQQQHNLLEKLKHYEVEVEKLKTQLSTKDRSEVMLSITS